ncbi:MAG: exonuclease SbcCD subunit D [Candidatus Pacearchaeota archaeon]
MKFGHLADCHLGGWRQEELQTLNLQSFRKAIDICIKEKVDFILIAGDLFDSAYPPIEILKETFSEFKRIKDEGIPVFLIAGSHDFSASGKTFLDVLEKAGFCKNVDKFELDNNKIKLKPTLIKDVAIFGYSGKKSGMEIEDLKKVYLEGVYPFSILMIHTTIEDVVGGIPMDFIKKEELPLANYYCLGHIHKIFEKRIANSVFSYPGPIFPNNFQELTDLNCGSFNLVNVERGLIKVENIKIPLKEVITLELEIDNGLTATQKIINSIDKLNLKDKIFLLKLKGTIKVGTSGDIKFNEIENFIKAKGAYSFLRNISSLINEEKEISIKIEDNSNLEEAIIKKYVEESKESFSKIAPLLINALSIEKNEDEKNNIFEERLMSELKKILETQNLEI